LFKVITWGIPKHRDARFTTRLKTGEIADLVAYVMTLGARPPAPDRAPVILRALSTPQAKEGRALFFDAARTGFCGTCNEAGRLGRPDRSRSRGAAARNLQEFAPGRDPGVVTARPVGEPPFPALLVERTDSRVRVYDLTANLPVLRSFPGRTDRH